jgi:SAM-dependent methyltransferase
MDRCSVQTVIDVGCGDWTYSRHLDFSGRQYLGIDVVPSVIARNIAEFGAPNVRFTQENLCAPGDLPDCDLLLCKDVLQHLSTANVMAILGKIGGARMALITNDYHPSNRDCSNGDTRPLDVSAPPFNFPGRPVLAFGGKVSFLAQSST